MTARRAPTDALGALLIARASLLYLLSLHASAHALVAWDAATARQPLGLALWALAQAASLLAADRLGGPMVAWADGVGRDRFRTALAIFYAAAVVLAPALLTADPSLVGREVRFFASLQVALLLLSASDRGVAGVVVNALTLTILAALRGGPIAAAATTGQVAWLGSFLVFDRFSRTLAAYPPGRAPALVVPLAQAAGTVGPVVAALAAAFVAAPPTAFAPALPAAAVPEPGGKLAVAYGLLTLVAVLGTAGIFFVARWLRRARRRQARVAEAVEPIAVGEEALPAPRRRARVAYPGLRGRIVRTYVRFLDQAERVAVGRRPSQTPREYAALLAEPAAPLAALTDLFMLARYGPDDPGEDDARAAERAASAAIAGLKLPRRRSTPRAGDTL